MSFLLLGTGASGHSVVARVHHARSSVVNAKLPGRYGVVSAALW